jgi:hypothetical protein
MPWNPFNSNPPPQQLLLGQQNNSTVANLDPAEITLQLDIVDNVKNMLVCGHQNRINAGVIIPWNKLLKSKGIDSLNKKSRFSNCSVLLLEIKEANDSDKFEISLDLVYEGDIARNKKGKSYWVTDSNLNDQRYSAFTALQFQKSTITATSDELKRVFGINDSTINNIKTDNLVIRCFILRHAFSVHNNKKETGTNYIINTSLLPVGEKDAFRAGEKIGRFFKKNMIILDDIGCSDLIRTIQTLKQVMDGINSIDTNSLSNFNNNNKAIFAIPCANEILRPGITNTAINVVGNVLTLGNSYNENKTNCRSTTDINKDRNSLLKAVYSNSLVDRSRKDCGSIALNNGKSININWDLFTKDKYFPNREGYRDQNSSAGKICTSLNFIGLFLNKSISPGSRTQQTEIMSITKNGDNETVIIGTDDERDSYGSDDDDDDADLVDPNRWSVDSNSSTNSDKGWKSNYGADAYKPDAYKPDDNLTRGGKLRKSRKSRNTKKSKKSKKYRKTKKARKNRKTRKTRK